MAQKTKTLRAWSRAEVKLLRTLAGRKSAQKISRELKRTEGAIYQRASNLGVSLRMR
jgi:hypothetical protein